MYKIIDLFREIKFVKQFIMRGFSDKKLWSLDITLAKWFLPRLKAFVEISNKQWNEKEKEDLQEIIWMFTKIADNSTIESRETINRCEKVKKLFVEYLDKLWY
jgi:hypothetical protein